MYSPLNLITLVCVLLLGRNAAIRFGFTVCDTAVPNERTEDIGFFIIYNRGTQRYQCETDQPLWVGDEFLCDTNDITPDTCAYDYWVQIATPLEFQEFSGQHDDVCVDKLIIEDDQGNLIYYEAGNYFIGDGSGNTADRLARRFHLGLDGQPDDPSATLDSDAYSDSRFPTCYKGTYSLLYIFRVDIVFTICSFFCNKQYIYITVYIYN